MNDTNEATRIDTAVDLATVAVAGGSVTGRHHRRLDRPNQDAWAVARHRGCVVAAVCDGCGSGRRSEVGATIAARLWVRTIVDAVAAGGALDDAGLWAAARARVVAVIGALVDAVGGDALVDIGLFTSLVAAVSANHAAVYAVGDGLVAVDDDVRELGPFADDRPPYIGYDLIGAPAPATLFLAVPAANVASICLASDGAGELTSAELDELRDRRLVRNPDSIRRRLAVLHHETITVDRERGTVVRRGPRFADDTTVVVLHRGAP